ncbi:MAG: hypothetical protein AAF226_05305 [Verrucomicrobiota bacterium]
MSLPLDRSLKIRDSLPESGLFAEKSWRISPDPFPLDKKTVKKLERLGPIFYRFQKAADLIYRRSRKGGLPKWVADYLDAGKPSELIEQGLSGTFTEAVPRVIRPDLLLTENGFTASELDSVPGGIGLTAWLAEVYARANPDKKIIGGEMGMVEGFRSIFPKGSADILVSDEAADYRPEMEWLVRERLGNEFDVHRAESYQPSGRDLYRFYELFDIPNIPDALEWGRKAAGGEFALTSPHKPWLEEKMWSALFWSNPLRDVWIPELRAANYQRLKDVFPQSWIVDPAEVPHYATIPGLEIQSFEELKGFSQTQRELVLKLSGFNERAWGSRSVSIGHDLSKSEWCEAVEEAINSFDSSPYVLQRFHQSMKITHNWLNEETKLIEKMEGRVRLCPYYFVDAISDKVRLCGVLATICPSDKKIIHGMSESILVPCCVTS